MLLCCCIIVIKVNVCNANVDKNVYLCSIQGGTNLQNVDIFYKVR